MAKNNTKLSHILAKKVSPEQLEELKSAMTLIKDATREYRNVIGYCPCCDAKIDDVITSYPKEVVLEVLGMAMLYYRVTGKHEFSLKELQEKTSKRLSHTAYCNINHFCRFGGIMYRPIDPKTDKPYKSSHFGINIERAQEFFRGERKAPVKIVSNRFTGENVTTDITVKDFPSITKFIDEDGFYDPYTLEQDNLL